MKREFDKLRVCQVDLEGHARTCGYWFIVTNGAQSHTAFAHRSSLLRWIDERGLKLTEGLAEHGEWKPQKIEGKYKSRMHLSYVDFYSLLDEAIHTRKLSNGKYTLGLITTDEDGTKTVHYLNPNCHYRPDFDYAESRAAHG